MFTEPSKQEFVSFDGAVREQGRLRFIDKLSSDSTGIGDDELFITRGAGLSMAAASFGRGITTIDAGRLNYIELLDPINREIRLGSGTPVGPLLDFLLKNQFYIPILPGYPTIEVGGCIAADVHGKNHFKDGTFIKQILSLEIFHPDYGVVKASREENEELFELSCGGFGLSGTILSVELKLWTLPSCTMDVVTEVVDILDLPQTLRERAGKSDFVFSWHDFVQTGAAFGKGLIKWGTFSSAPDTRDSVTTVGQETAYPIHRLGNSLMSPLTLTSQTRGLLCPAGFGYATTGLMNSLYRNSELTSCGAGRVEPVSHCYFPNKFLRDLYFHFFGGTGFFESQTLIPAERFPEFVDRVKWWLGENELPITIATGKMFQGTQRLLRFDGEGICFALNFPRCQTGLRFLEYLDEITVQLGSLPNIIKDSRLPLRVVERAYPQYEEFRRRLREFDPKRRYQSELSRRLAL
ncbi:MAG: FAD-binding oxidoreductase [Cyanobacteria bacterium]|nr:FAD-binding oxidoreductase [Cyanobacteriota bacterium]